MKNNHQQIIIGLVGETGSGKDTVANFYQKKYGARLTRFAEPLNEILNFVADKPSKQDQQWLALELKKHFGKEILCRILARKIEKLPEKIIIVNGLRFMEDLEFIKSLPNSYVIYVTADPKKRWQRISARKEKTDDKSSFREFQKREKSKTEVQIPRIGKKADFTIKNEQDLDFLLNSAKEIVEQLTK